jgi:hypothetical protein
MSKSQATLHPFLGSNNIKNVLLIHNLFLFHKYSSMGQSFLYFFVAKNLF